MTTDLAETIPPVETYPKGPGWAWTAWSIPAIFFLYEFLIRVSPSVIIEDLETQFRTGSGEMGFDMSLYYYAYAPMQLIVGLLLDRLGGRTPLAIAAIICGAGCLLFAVASGPAGLGGGRFLMGFGSAFAYVGTVYVASIWFPRERIALLSGLTAALGMLGAISAEALLGQVLSVLSWREAFDIFAALAMIIAVLMWFLIPRNPAWHVEQVERDRATHGGGMISGLKCVLANQQTWILALVTGLLYLPVGTFAALWGNDYLQKLKGFEPTEAGMAVALIFVGIAVSGPLLGWFSDRRRRRVRYLKVGTLVALVSGIGLWAIPDIPVFLVYVLLVTIGLGAGSLVLAFPLAMDHNPRHSRGTAMTFVNFMQMIMAGLGQWAVGLLIAAIDKNPTNHPSGTAFRLSFLILPGALFVAFILVQFLREPGDMGKAHPTTPSLPLGD